MRFMLLMIPRGYDTAAPGTLPDPQAVQRMMAYNRELQHAGVLLGLDGLHPPSMGARISFAEGHARIVGRPLAAPGEVLGGYWMIDVGSLAEAIEWARRCPAGPDDIIDIRQVQEMTDFSPKVRAAVTDAGLGG